MSNNISKLSSHEYLRILFSLGLVNFNDKNDFMVTFIQFWHQRIVFNHYHLSPYLNVLECMELVTNIQKTFWCPSKYEKYILGIKVKVRVGFVKLEKGPNRNVLEKGKNRDVSKFFIWIPGLNKRYFLYKCNALPLRYSILYEYALKLYNT